MISIAAGEDTSKFINRAKNGEQDLQIICNEHEIDFNEFAKRLEEIVDLNVKYALRDKIKEEVDKFQENIQSILNALHKISENIYNAVDNTPLIEEWDKKELIESLREIFKKKG